MCLRFVHSVVLPKVKKRKNLRSNALYAYHFFNFEPISVRATPIMSFEDQHKEEEKTRVVIFRGGEMLTICHLVIW
jgi:hypothetical protein